LLPAGDKKVNKNAKEPTKKKEERILLLART
jgi:hypothetical protein